MRFEQVENSILLPAGLNVDKLQSTLSLLMGNQLDYGDLFHPDDGPSTNKLPYDIFSMIFFLCFLVVMPILIMNLLVRLRKFK